MRNTLFGLSLLTALGFSISLCAQDTASGSVPGFSAADRLRCESLARQVTIIRDNWGIPHIYGKTDATTVFGLLYAECEEDFSRVEKNYLEMLGRQSEVYGDSYLYTDVMMRLIYDSAQAIKDYRNSPEWMHALLDAFADGINYYLFKHPQTHPLVLHRFEPWYALMFTDGSVSATSTGGIRMEEIKEFYSQHMGSAKRKLSEAEKMVLMDRGMLAPDKDAGAGKDSARINDPAREKNSPENHDHVWMGDAAAPETGSNGFAIAPSRTASGNALLYINPHVPFYFRMEVQVTSEEGLNAYGAVTWGQFFIYQGFNAHCGWMHTSSYADVADLYEEKTRERDGDWTYEYEGQTRPVRVRTLKIGVRDGDMLRTQKFTGFYTHHGPVMGSRDGKWLSLKEYNRSLPALEESWLITKAAGLEEFKKAMDLRANTTNNTVYADDKGNIAYWHGNFMPRRDTAFNWSLPVDGQIAATEWKGVHELDEIVHLYNPKTGWIQNCNSTPYAASGASSPVRGQYPAYMAPDGQNFRALNAVRLLNRADHWTLDSLIANGYDRYLTAFDVLLPSLLDAYHAAGESIKNTLKEPIGYLAEWDRRSAVNSIGATLAIEWATRMARYAPRPKTTEDATNAVANMILEITASTNEQKLEELSTVIASLQDRFGSWKIAWGELNRYQRLTGKIAETYDDNQPSLPSGLASSAFGALPSFQSRTMPGTKKRYGYSGNSFIAAIEFGKTVKARTVITGGESSDPGSPHFSDQARMYLDGKMKDVLFYKEDVLRHVDKQYQPGQE